MLVWNAHNSNLGILLLFLWWSIRIPIRLILLQGDSVDWVIKLLHMVGYQEGLLLIVRCRTEPSGTMVRVRVWWNVRRERHRGVGTKWQFSRCTVFLRTMFVKFTHAIEFWGSLVDY